MPSAAARRSHARQLTAVGCATVLETRGLASTSALCLGESSEISRSTTTLRETDAVTASSENFGAASFRGREVCRAAEAASRVNRVMSTSTTSQNALMGKGPAATTGRVMGSGSLVPIARDERGSMADGRCCYTAISATAYRPDGRVGSTTWETRRTAVSRIAKRCLLITCIVTGREVPFLKVFAERAVCFALLGLAASPRTTIV